MGPRAFVTTFARRSGNPRSFSSEERIRQDDQRRHAFSDNLIYRCGEIAGRGREQTDYGQPSSGGLRVCRESAAPHAGCGAGEHCEDLSPPCMSGKEHSEG